MMAVWTWLALGCCLLISFFLSGMEAGVQSLSRLRLRHWMRQGRPGTATLLAYLENSENFLWTILVGNTLANLTAMALMVIQLRHWFQSAPFYFWLGVAGVWLLLYLGCELLPKTLFRRYPNRLCLHLLWPYRVVHGLLSPCVLMAEWLANLLLRWTGDKRSSGHLFGNREEVLDVMRQSTAALSTREKALIDRVMTLQNTTVSRLAQSLDATPSVDEQATVEQVLQICREYRVSRVPVWRTEGTKRRVIGVASLRDLLYAQIDRKAPVIHHMRRTLFLETTSRLEPALQRMQRSGQHLAILVGPDRRECGTITLWDILKCIFDEMEA